MARIAHQNRVARVSARRDVDRDEVAPRVLHELVDELFAHNVPCVAEVFLEERAGLFPCGDGVQLVEGDEEREGEGAVLGLARGRGGGEAEVRGIGSDGIAMKSGSCNTSRASHEGRLRF